MMSKRFYIHCADDINRQLFDTESDFNIHIEEIGSEGELIKLCNLLNEQQATINKLKSDIEETEISIKLFEDDVNKLSEENEQLRQIMNDIVVATDETYTKNASVFKVTVVLDFEKYMEIRRCIE